jgi:signal transduction histidine kinase
VNRIWKLTPPNDANSSDINDLLGCAGCAPAVMTTSSSRSPSRNCWPVSRRSPDAAIASSKTLCCASGISSSTWYHERSAAVAEKSTCCRENSRFSNTWFATKARLSRGRCCCSTYGISILTPGPTSSTFTSDASAARSTLRKPIHSSIQSVASGFVSVLLAKTLRSSTFKLALICIAIFGAMVFVLLGYVYWSTASYVRNRSDHALTTELAIMQRAYAIAGRSGLITTIAQRLADQRFEGGAYLLADPSFAPLAGNLADWPPAMKGSKGWGNFSAREGRSVLRSTFATLPDGSHLLVGKDIDDLDEFAAKIKAAAALCIVLILVLAGVASVSVTRRTVGRIEAINATSRAIMQSGLGQRIPLRATRDEWDELAANLNSMLDRIEALMREVKQVTDNVAHDLRTPLARMRGRLEKAYNKQRDGDRDQSLIGDTMADLENVLRMFASLTRISQIEAYDRIAAFRSVNLVEIASEVVELFDAAAEDKGGHLKVVGGPSVLATGDRDLLFDAVANLVDYAIKYGGDAGQVTVEVKENDGGAVISVVDDGPGIPVDERQHVFKRFYRLEQSRGTPGNGLGLSLVAAVARLHGAHIEIVDKVPGLKIQLRFPSKARSDLENSGTLTQLLS